MKLRTLLLSAGLLSLTGVAQAALHDRGGGMIYDDVLDVTWLQDANYAKTSGYDADGYFNSWQSAYDWVNQLVVGGLDDWRLPNSHWFDTSGNEMADLFYNSLGGQSGVGLASAYPFVNIQTESFYWNEKFTQGPGAGVSAAGFDMGTGSWVASGLNNWAVAWAVRDGDLAAVPEPETYALMLAGLGLVVWAARRRAA